MSACLSLALRSLSQAPLPPVDIAVLRARDASGAFAIQPGHADFVTVLVPSLLEWRDGNGTAFCAGVPGGVLHVRAGREVAILARRLYFGDSPADVLQALQTGLVGARADEARLHDKLARLEAEATAHLARRMGEVPATEQTQ